MRGIDVNEGDKVESAAPATPPATKKKGTDWAAEAKGIFWLILAVLGFHSFIAKPFYIPSESMMPGLLVGDRLVVTKYPYGWSFVSPTFHLLPYIHGRLFGRLPERGDVVIVSPPGEKQDYIKRVIGLPGDRLEMRNGTVIINGVPIKRSQPTPRLIPVDENAPCSDLQFPGRLVTGPDNKPYCELPIVHETLPNGRSYDTIELGASRADDFPPLTIPPNQVFLMGDNRDRSADSRVPLIEGGLGGPVPWENIGGRAEFITFSLDGSAEWYNPISWIEALRPGRAGTSLHPQEADSK
ncbi:signal peptidase I [Sphingomonas changbaiensis]|uniref:signal peptidase I n=1 Tax=Sphingomonas changbaiensis TaxID=529705 RepID=UPI0009FF1E25